jgi:DNA-binding NtrC family response regulator
MKDRVLALLVHDQTSPVDSLRRALKGLSIGTYSVRTCSEAERLLAQIHPQVVFTEISLSDGSWSDILNLAGKAPAPVNVIVVGATPDTKQYLDVMEGGAFDFVAPPFEPEPLGFVVRSAELHSAPPRGLSSAPA